MKFKFSLVLLLLLVPVHVFAMGAFEVTPLRVFISPKDKMSSIKVTNNADQKLTIQMNSVTWTQDEEGNDVLDPTKEVLFFPKMVTLEPKKEVVIRIGLKSKEDIDTEKTYRLFVRELPVTKPGEKPTLQMVLNVGVPIFFQPNEIKHDAVLEGADFSDTKIRLKVKNGGNSHALISKIVLIGSNGSKDETFNKEVKGWYVLHGKSRTFPVDLPYEGCADTDMIKAELTLVGVEEVLTGTYKLNKDFCPKEPPPPVEEKPKKPPKELLKQTPETK